jgi:hypothetical protein
MAKKSINIRAGFDLKAFSTSSQNLQRQLRSSGKKMQSIGKSMSMSLTAPIAILGGLAVKTFANFEQSMAKVQAISGAVGKDFQNLTNLAKDLGIATRFSASEVSELMLNYSKLGFSSEEIQKITAATLDLALATGEDLAQSASVAGGTLRGFGLEAGEMTRVTDVMARAFSGSALDLQKFQNSMPKVSAVASSLGITLEETTSMLGVLVGKNIQATTAGTGLKNIFLKTRKSGISFKDAMDKIKNSIDPANTAMDMFGVENAQVAVALSQSGDAITEMNAKLSDTSVTASSMAAIMDATLEGSMMRLKSATEGLAISFGEIMAPAVGFVADILSKIAMRFANLNPYVKTAITVFAGLIAVLGPLAFAIGGIKLALATLMANPIILWVVGISAALAGLVAVFMYVKDNAQFFADFFYNLWVNIANNTLDAVKTIAKGLAKFAGLFGIDIGVDEFFDKFKLEPREATKELKSFKETLKGIKKEVTGLTQAGEDSVLDVTPEGGGTTTGKTKSTAIAIQAPPQKGIENVTSQISEMANQAIEPIQIQIEPLTNQELGIVTQAEELGKKAGESLSSGLKSLATEGLVSFGNFLGSVMSGGDMTMQDFGRGLLNSIGGFMQQFGEAMIAIGIAEAMVDASIKSMNPALAIAGGIALVAAGAALTNLSKKGIDTGGGGNVPAPSMAGGGMGAMNTQPIALETKISGRDLILVQNREKGFSR